MTIRKRVLPVLLVLAACESAEDDDGSAARADSTRDTLAAAGDSSPSPQRVPDPATATVFDPARVRVGDTIAGLRVDSADVRRAIHGDWIGSVRFAGEVRLSGAYQPHPSEEVDALCFFVAEEHRARLPRFPADARRPWFCFANQEEARTLLRPPPDSGRAEIVVDRFIYHFAHTDVVNEARLLRVLTRG